MWQRFAGSGSEDERIARLAPHCSDVLSPAAARLSVAERNVLRRRMVVALEQALALKLDAEWRRCASESCDRWFVVPPARPMRIYCCRRCTRRQAQRNYERRRIRPRQPRPAPEPVRIVPRFSATRTTT
jgi:hypothetical protein